MKHIKYEQSWFEYDYPPKTGMEIQNILGEIQLILDV